MDVPPPAVPRYAGERPRGVWSSTTTSENEGSHDGRKIEEEPRGNGRVRVWVGEWIGHPGQSRIASAASASRPHSSADARAYLGPPPSQSQLNIPLNGGHPSHGQMARPSVEQQAPGQNWSVPTTAGLPYPPQWQNTPSRASSYAHQRFPSLSTPARPSASHPRPQHSRSHSTANPASVYARSPGSASHPNMFAHHRSASNTSGFNSSPFASPQGRLRTSVSANSLHSQVPYDLQSSSSTDTLDGQTATLNIVDGNPWTSVSPSNAMYAQQSQYLPPSLSPSVSSTYSFAAGQPHTPRSASISSFGGLSSANTSPSGYSTTSLASVQGQRKRPRRKSAQAGTSEGPGPSTRQTYAPQMPAQRPVSLLKRPSPAKTVASAKKPAPKRTSAGPKLATGESVKRPEAVEAVAQLLACGGNPFLRTKGQPRYPFLVGADEVRGANNAMSPDQKYEMLWLCDKFPGVKQEDVAKHCESREKSSRVATVQTRLRPLT